jgi:hypothetical protein
MSSSRDLATSCSVYSAILERLQIAENTVQQISWIQAKKNCTHEQLSTIFVRRCIGNGIRSPSSPIFIFFNVSHSTFDKILSLHERILTNQATISVQNIKKLHFFPCNQPSACFNSVPPTRDMFNLVK